MSNDRNQDIKEALFELQCISEIMQELGRGKNDEVPATWMDWLSKCVSNVADRVDLAST
jgi:hypothetical protein